MGDREIPQSRRDLGRMGHLVHPKRESDRGHRRQPAGPCRSGRTVGRPRREAPRSPVSATDSTRPAPGGRTGIVQDRGATRRETGWGEPLGWDRMRLSGLRSGRRMNIEIAPGRRYRTSRRLRLTSESRRSTNRRAADSRSHIRGSSVGRNDGRFAMTRLWFAMTRLFCGVGSPSGLFVGSPSIRGGDLRKFLICVHKIQNLRHSYSR